MGNGVAGVELWDPGLARIQGTTIQVCTNQRLVRVLLRGLDAIIVDTGTAS
jgi:hypothetical protein